MSATEIEAFLEKVGEDGPLHEQVAALQSGPPENLVTGLVTLSRENGFNIPASEWAAFLESSATHECVDDDPDENTPGMVGYEFDDPEPLT